MVDETLKILLLPLLALPSYSIMCEVGRIPLTPAVDGPRVHGPAARPMNRAIAKPDCFSCDHSDWRPEMRPLIEYNGLTSSLSFDAFSNT
jgi:hypothetical protein